MTRKRRLLCLVQLPPPVHGASVVNQRVVDSALIREHFDVEVLPLRFASAVEALGRASAGKALRATAIAGRLVETIARRRPDAVYFTMATSGFAMVRDAAYLAVLRTLRVPVILHVHAQGLGRIAPRVAPLLRGATVILLSTRFEHEVAGLDDVHVRYVANGIPDEYVPHDRPPGPPRVLFLSNMIREKGPLVLLEALRRLRARGVEVDATFAGARFHDGCVEELESGLRASGLADRVRYVGPVFGEDKAALFRAADVFAHPTLNDAFPLVVLEAMQWGLPVVSTREGALPDIVDDGTTGYLVEPGDAVALADRLQQLVEAPALAQTLGAAGRARYLARFTLERFEHALVDALDTAVPRPRE